MEVSVIVLSYNSMRNKMLATLKSIICQVDINYEVIIADDGSVDFCKEYIVELLKDSGVDFCIIDNIYNEGTILNLKHAVEKAKGDYIYTISPGDMLYDEKTLADLVSYARKHNEYSFFFGRPIFYSNIENNLVVYNIKAPIFPEVYLPYKGETNIKKIAFHAGETPIGASYFRKKDLFLKYLDLAVYKVRYLEDYSTSSFYIFEGKDLCFIDRNVVWYEYGTGISNNIKEPDKWKASILYDFKETHRIDNACYSSNPLVRIKCGGRWRCFFHPVLCLRILKIKFMEKLYAKRNFEEFDNNAFYDLNLLKSYLQTS